MDIIHDKKQYAKILKKININLEEVKKIFFDIRDEISKGDFNSIKKKYNGIVKTEKTIENGKSVEYTKIFKDSRDSVILYTIKYSIGELSITIGNDEYVKGIYFVRFYDFDCKNPEEIIFNHYSIDKIKHYVLKFTRGGTIDMSFSVKDRDDKSALGRFVSFVRKLR